MAVIIILKIFKKKKINSLAHFKLVEFGKLKKKIKQFPIIRCDLMVF